MPIALEGIVSVSEKLANADTTREDIETMAAICKRFEDYSREYHLPVSHFGQRIDRMMDLELAHIDCPIDLAGLLAAEDGDFVHDVCGIHRHMDRSTGVVGGCFSPRLAARA